MSLSTVQCERNQLIYSFKNIYLDLKNEHLRLSWSNSVKLAEYLHNHIRVLQPTAGGQMNLYTRYTRLHDPTSPTMSKHEANVGNLLNLLLHV